MSAKVMSGTISVRDKWVIAPQKNPRALPKTVRALSPFYVVSVNGTAYGAVTLVVETTDPAVARAAGESLAGGPVQWDAPEPAAVVDEVAARRRTRTRKATT